MKLALLVLTAACFPACAQAPAQSSPRVFVTDSTSWQVAGTHGGARPQTAEIIKTFRERCPAVTVTTKQESADFVVQLDHEGGKGAARKRNKVVVASKAGDVIFTSST